MKAKLPLCVINRNYRLLCTQKNTPSTSTSSSISPSPTEPASSSLLMKEATTTAKLQDNSISNPVTSSDNVISNDVFDSINWLPNFSKPYLRLARVDKQVGTLLLLWPCCWSVALATPLGALPDFFLLSKFALGAFIMRGAGCTINDLWDKDFDKHVARTKSRPLASGALTVPQALTFLGLQLGCGLGVLLTFNTETIMLGLASMPLVIAYPLMKRFTNWPQLILGLTFNWGALVGWTAVHGSISLTDHALPLYASGVCWTLVYDTLYGYQDRRDDAKLGLKSTSLHLGDSPQLALTAISCGMISLLTLSGMNANLTLPFYVGVGTVGGQLLWQIWTADINDSSNLWARFRSNQYSGAVVMAAIVAGHF